MSLMLLAPAGLLALAAWLVPLLIHLHRRRPQQTLLFAALRWMPAQHSPRRQWRIEQVLLLLLRLLLLALAALLLAQPMLQRDADSAAMHVAVVPGADLAAARELIQQPDARWLWLAPGFPGIASRPADHGDSASLLRELDATLPPSVGLVVVAPAEVTGLDGERPQLQREVDWHVTAGQAAPPLPAPPPPIRLAFAPSDDDATQRYLDGLITTWQDMGHEVQLQALDATQTPSADGAWLVVSATALTAGLHDWIDSGGRALLLADGSSEGLAVWHDTQGRVLARHAPSGKGQVLRLATALDPQQLPELLAADFPQQLLGLIQEQPQIPAWASAAMLKPVTGASVSRLTVGRVGLHNWLIMLLVLCWLAERLVAARAGRRQ